MEPSSSPSSVAELTAQLDWLRALSREDTHEGIAPRVIALARQHPDCTDAQLCWPHSGAVEAQGTACTGALVRAAAEAGQVAWSDDGLHAALPLSGQPGAAVLALTFSRPRPPVPVHWAEDLPIAERKLRRLQALERMRASIAGLERAEQLQRALFAISDLAGSDRDMPEMLRGIHEIIGTLMYAENFFIVLHDAERDSLRFLYFADVVDPAPFSEMPMDALEHTFTWYLIRHGKPLMGSTEQLRRQVPGTANVVGTDSFDWLGVPMMGEDRVYGALVVQSYEESVRYSEEDRSLLGFVASHVLTALERKQSKDALEQRVHLVVELGLADVGRRQFRDPEQRRL